VIPPNGIDEILAVFGNPANEDGTLNESWEGQNIRKVAPPDGWQLFYQADAGPVVVSGIRMHRFLEDSFHAVLDEIWRHADDELGGGADVMTIRGWLHRRRLDQHGGGFNFRNITGGRRLSLHSFGIALDWDPDHNPRQAPMRSTLPSWWYDVWAEHGWIDGRGFRTPDPMHVQFARGA
jgi:hypothetical protein